MDSYAQLDHIQTSTFLLQLLLICSLPTAERLQNGFLTGPSFDSRGREQLTLFLKKLSCAYSRAKQGVRDIALSSSSRDTF